MYIGGCKIDAAYLGSCRLGKLYLGMCEVLGGAPVLPKWRAFVPDPDTGEMAGIIGGTGDATNAREAIINLRNHDDLYGQQNALKVGYAGGRLVGSTVYGTDDQGDPLPEMPWAVRFPQVTNLATNCRTLTGSDWTGGNQIQITPNSVLGIDGSLSAATADDASTGLSYIGMDSSQLIPGGTGTAIFFVKNDPSYTEWVGVRVTPRNAALQLNVVVFNPQTGEVSGALTTATDYDVTVVDGWWRIAITVTDANAGNTYWQCTLYPAYSSNGISQSNTAEQAVFCDAVQFYEGYEKDLAIALAKAPIYTETAEVIRDPDDIQLDPSNHDNGQGTYYLEANLTGPCNILGEFLQYDETNITLVNPSGTSSVIAATGVHKIGLVWGNGKMRLNVDGTWGADVDYDGTLLNGAFDVGRNSEWPVYVRNFPAYENKDESIIDGLME